MLHEQMPEPWQSFLAQIDESLQEEVRLHCFGGFVVTMLYGLARATADLDVMLIAPGSVSQALLRLAGKGSDLHLWCVWGFCYDCGHS